MAITENRKAYFDYEILESFEAGIELFGFEVKAVKTGRMNLNGAHVIIRGNESWLINADIPPYQPLNTPTDYDPKRTRRLLLKHEEIASLIGKTHEKGLTLIPLKVYIKRQKIKIEIGLARSKKKADKREDLKKKADRREMRGVS